ncbi:MAG: RNA polymerase sigma factor [Alistipes sp.]|nr:RNA polymerase sigma factor [Alistipes sp.]
MKTETQYIEFFSKHRDTLYRLALNICGDSIEAEDVVQDVFERVWRARDKVLNSTYPKAYICRIAHNLAIDRERTRRRRQTFSVNEEITTNDINISAELSDITSITQRAIASLPEKQRLAIHLRDVEGYEIEEIAEVLECDSTSVRMNLSRARSSVREKITNALNYGIKRD